MSAEAFEEATVKVVHGLASTFEIARSIPGRDALDDDGALSFVHAEASTPLLHREGVFALGRLLDAAIRMRLRAERECSGDPGAEVEAGLGRDPLDGAF